MTATTWNARTQGSTLITADHYGEVWTPDEVAFVIEFTDDATDEEIAVSLGRSLYAIWAIQHRIAAGDIDFAAGRATTAPVRPLSNRTYTFIGDDVPEGW